MGGGGIDHLSAKNCKFLNNFSSARICETISSFNVFARTFSNYFQKYRKCTTTIVSFYPFSQLFPVLMSLQELFQIMYKNIENASQPNCIFLPLFAGFLVSKYMNVKCNRVKLVRAPGLREANIFSSHIQPTL